MAKLSTLIATGAVLAMTGTTAAFALAGDNVTGAWSYKVGAGNPCTVTFSGSDAGDIAESANCPGGLSSVAHYRMNGTHLELMSPNGELVAVLHRTEAGYMGDQIGGGRKVFLTRA